MNIFSCTPETINSAVEIIKKGGVVAFPTETVYGLGADAYNPKALAKVFEIKNRPYFDPLIIHIADIQTLEDVADLSLLSEKTKQRLFLLSDNFWPGPLSIILPKNKKIPGIATAGLPTAAIRFPLHEAAQKLISQSTNAVAAPSANPFGALSPTRAQHVLAGLGDKVDMILDGGPAQIGLESTVIDLSTDSARILRAGGVPKEAIESIIGDRLHEKGEKESGFASPGQLKSHYAPGTPLFTFTKDEINSLSCENDAAYIFFDDFSRKEWVKKQESTNNSLLSIEIRVLSPSGSLPQAASCLFETLHELDFGKFSRIYAQLTLPCGLGIAINDRLIRASFK
jgi:L-threonylcarbamoyladenylate synthase